MSESNELICNYCLRKVAPIDCKEDGDDDQMTCDTCGSMAIEWPGIGIVCVKSGKPLIEVQHYWLYHPDTYSMWERLKYKMTALFSILLLLLVVVGCAVRVQKTTDTIDLHTGKSTETVTECYAFEMVSVEDPCKKKKEPQ